MTANFYEQQRSRGLKLEETKEKLSDEIDYEKPFTYIYSYPDFYNNGTEARSYSDIYDLYLKLSGEGLSLIRNYLNDFEKSLRPDLLISDPSYWQMMVYFSIVEKVIGRQPLCKNTVGCAVCGTNNIPHSPLSAKQWIHDRLLEIIGDEKVAKEYEDVILFVRQKIRHDTVHNSLVPSANRYEDTPAGLTVYDLDKSSSTYKSDFQSVRSLIEMIKSVSRNLLIDNQFHLGYFSEPQPMNVLHLEEPGVAMRGGTDKPVSFHRRRK